MSLVCDTKLATGMEVRITLPGTDAPVAARAVRNEGGLLGLAFRQDEAMLKQVDRALDHIGGVAKAA